MTTDQPADGALSPELEAIATAAHDRLKAQAGQDLSAVDDAGRRVADARLSAIADAEREGEQRARHELSADVLRQVTRAAKRKREADSEYEEAIGRAGRLGLSPREIATAAQVSHGTHPRDPHPHQHHHRQRRASPGAAVQPRTGRDPLA
jgi:hypothetical protein